MKRTETETTAELPTLEKIATINPPSIAGLAACQDDARLSALDGDPGPAEPSDYFQLRGRLEAVRTRFPPLYQEAFVTPYINALDDMGVGGFTLILISDPNRVRAAALLLDIAQAILQQGEGYAAQSTDAFQEVVSDLYDGFLSAEDRRGVNPPDKGVIPPLVKWGNPQFGPYTWPIEATSVFDVGAAVVNLPPANIRMGLLAWCALGHETAGHDILHADTGLMEELADAIHQKLAPLGHGLDEYWSSRIDETASDVLGILNMGPAAGIGLIGYFRGLNAAFGGEGRLRNEGPENDPHPADIVRGYLAAETVNLLKFTGHTKWASAIAAETDKDVDTIILGDTHVSQQQARNSAKLVAETLVTFKARSLEQHALGDIQNWRDTDERKVRRARTALRAGANLPETILTGTYAAHVVAAAIVEALADTSGMSMVFNRMQAILKSMHDANSSWGPLYIGHPGDLDRHLAYIPQCSGCAGAAEDLEETVSERSARRGGKDHGRRVRVSMRSNKPAPLFRPPEAH